MGTLVAVSIRSGFLGLLQGLRSRESSLRLYELGLHAPELAPSLMRLNILGYGIIF